MSMTRRSLGLKSEGPLFFEHTLNIRTRAARTNGTPPDEPQLDNFLGGLYSIRSRFARSK